VYSAREEKGEIKIFYRWGTPEESRIEEYTQTPTTSPPPHNRRED
jgi:hypothetical protein